MSASEQEAAAVPRPRRALTATVHGGLVALGVWAVLTIVLWAVSPPILFGLGIGTHAPPPGWLWAVVGVLELAVLVIAFFAGRWRHRRLTSARGW